MTITDITTVSIDGDTMSLNGVEVFHGAIECSSCTSLVFVPAGVGDSDELVELYLTDHEASCAPQAGCTRSNRRG